MSFPWVLLNRYSPFFNLPLSNLFIFVILEKLQFYLQSVEGMKVVCHELTQLTADPESSILDDLVKEADRLVSCLANMVNVFEILLLIKMNK